MSLFSWFLKPSKEMQKKDTKCIKVGKYTVTAHAQNRTVEKARNLGKRAMVGNLYGKHSQNSRLYTHTDGTLQYDRVNDKNRTVTYITSNNYVKSIRKYHDKPREINKVYKHFKGR